MSGHCHPSDAILQQRESAAANGTVRVGRATRVEIASKIKYITEKTGSNTVSDSGCHKHWASESMVAKYRVLMAQTRDPVRAHMLQEMIDREIAANTTVGRRANGDAETGNVASERWR